MPRRVDYASRFALLRESAFALVCDRGVDALSRRALATLLGLSRNRIDDLLRTDVPLVCLAAQEVAERRRQGRWFITSAPPFEAACGLVGSLMPDDDTRLDEEMVWLRLVTHATARRDLAQPIADREEHVTATIHRALDLIGVPDRSRPDEAGHLRALIDGLTLGTVLGRLAPLNALDVVRRHLASLPDTPSPAG